MISRKRRSKISMLPSGVLIVGVMLSLLTYSFVEKLEEEKELDSFRNFTGQHTEVMKDKVESSIEAIRSIVALYAASNAVTRKDFAVFAQSEIQNRPNIQVIEWIPRVKAQERANFERRAQQDGLADFTFTERRHQDVMVTAGERAARS